MSVQSSVDSAFIIECDDAHFQSLVVENSRKGPVLVNFWNKNAGPCLRMYPELDALAKQMNGKFLLVNMDTQKCIQTTKELGISSVPTLKLFVEKEEKNTLHGYQKPDEISKILQPYIASESDQVIAQALQLYIQGSKEQAMQTLARQIIEDPLNVKLPLVMLKLLFKDKQFDSAARLFESIPVEIKNHPQIVEFGLMLEIHKMAEDKGLDAIQQQACQLFLSGNNEQPLALLFNEYRQQQNADYKNLMLKLFRLIKDEELVQQYRNRLQNAFH